MRAASGQPQDIPDHSAIAIIAMDVVAVCSMGTELYEGVCPAEKLKPRQRVRGGCQLELGQCSQHAQTELTTGLGLDSGCNHA